MNKYVKPRKAGSLLLAKEIFNIEKNHFYDYKILFLQRNSNLSWGNMMAFPGGNADPEDLDYVKSNLSKYSHYFDNEDDFKTFHLKVTALRETYEETGLYFLKNKLLTTDQFSLIETIFNHHKLHSKLPSFYELSNLLDVDFHNTHEFLRLVTVPFYKVRYDCQFFLMKIQQNKFINVPKSIESLSRLNEIDDLAINKKESADYKWLNPYECLALYSSNEIMLAPPQLMILNILTSFKKFEDFENYIKKIKANSYTYKGTDALRKNCLTFPQLITFINNNDEKFKKLGFPYIGTLPGDIEYPLEKILEFEKDEELKKEFEIKYRSISKDRSNKARFYFEDIQKMFMKDYDFEINFDFDHPFNYMKSSFKLQSYLLTPKL